MIKDELIALAKIGVNLGPNLAVKSGVEPVTQFHIIANLFICLCYRFLLVFTAHKALFSKYRQNVLLICLSRINV